MVYLIQTESDGAHYKAVGPVESISQLYESLPGEEVVIDDRHGVFPCKQLAESSGPAANPMMGP